MPSKVVTKSEAIRVGYYLCEAAQRTGDDALKLPEKVEHGFSSSWYPSYGKWRTTEFEVKSPAFRIYATRCKHGDGRIRDVVEEVEHPLSFACLVLSLQPNLPQVQLVIDKWAAMMSDHGAVRRTLAPHERPYLRPFAEGDDLAARIRAVDAARLLAKMSASSEELALLAA